MTVDPDLCAVQIRGLHKRFGTQEVLRGIDLGIPEGTVSVVLGPSGTGKSVLIRHVIGLLTPDAGDVLVRGRRLGHMSHAQLLTLRREFGVLFQDGALFGSMTVAENVAFPLRQHTDLTQAEIREVVLERLGEVGLVDAVDKMPGELSGGMRKRVGLARALVLDPSIVLCDEPDSGLDPIRTALLGELITKAHGEHGGTFVVITHDVALARKIGDYLAILWQGKIVESGPSDALWRSSDPFVRQFLSGETTGPLGMEA